MRLKAPTKQLIEKYRKQFEDKNSEKRDKGALQDIS
jgi:hypothetical protein